MQRSAFLNRTVLSAAAFVLSTGLAVGMALVGTTVDDFFQPGTQPGDLLQPIVGSTDCAACHAFGSPDEEPYHAWSGSMMAQAARDPIFHACMAIAEQDAGGSGDLCIRCHSPGGWLAGNSTPTDGSALSDVDYDGVTCNLCHRLVDPVFEPGVSPASDQGLLAGLMDAPTSVHTGQYVVDTLDRRRGPFDLGPGFPWHAWEQSPFHQESLLCANCHDVSNPAFERVGGATPAASDTYVLSTLATEHPTHDKFDEFPIERTYSEWASSAFAAGPIDLGGRFGGNKTLVSSCQDCHMPDTSGVACMPGLGGTFRNDLPTHGFDGANTWVPLAVYDLDQSLELYGAAEASGLAESTFQDAVDRNLSMLERASDLELTQTGDSLEARIINQTGHKLPTGYGEGRRMWINVQYFDAFDALIDERGFYDPVDADLTTADTKVYEIEHGIDAALSLSTGLPAAPSFHFVLNNTTYLDNRIPPRGFTNAGFEAVQANPVGYTYADGQYWDDTAYDIPCGAASATVRVYYQTTTKEYIEFLRDENVTNDAGDIAYDAWEARGKSEPALMDEVTLPLAPYMVRDVESISLSTGGAQTLCVNTGPVNAGKFYAVIGSAGGTFPGFPIAGVNIPLNFDFYLLFTLQQANNYPLVNNVGVLDGEGRATMQLNLLPGAPPEMAGTTLHHAVVVLDGTLPIDVSAPVAVDLVP